MTMKYSRAQRRADYARLKEKRQTHWGYGNQGWRQYCKHAPVKMSPALAGMVANTPTPCSCYMCGNPRRNSWADDPLTMQERKAADQYADEVEWNFGLYGYYDYSDDWYEDCCDEDPEVDWYLKWMYIK